MGNLQEPITFTQFQKTSITNQPNKKQTKKQNLDPPLAVQVEDRGFADIFPTNYLSIFEFVNIVTKFFI